MLPLVPGYLAYVTGLAGADLATPSRSRTNQTGDPGRAEAADDATGAVPTPAPPGAMGTDLTTRPSPAHGRAVAGATLFVAGFTAVFTLLAYAVGELGRILLVHTRTIELVAGVLIILLGLAFTGLLPGNGRSFRVNRLPPGGLAGAPVLGATVALSWTPCLSPTLTAVLGLAAVQGSAGRGTLLAAAYSLGMGLPFIAFASGLTRLLRLATFLRRHGAWITRLGALLLVAVGLALATGAWNAFITWLRITIGPGQIGI
ncbi:MAG: cytochrome c biogenesis protein CcdA [Micromonosporaceae bacterium]|nr:cytochrome c biogenesis protein CcdA [Micromonosporaceae bacterium]